MTLEEYFVFEEASATRHEFVHGQVHAMSGVTRRHSRITMNIAAQVWIAARGGPCRVHRGEVKVQTNGVIYYPDVMTACGAEPRDLRVEDAPAVVVEVLSPSTERIDRGEKLLVYREIPSLRAYLIVDRDRRLVEHYWRDPGGEWQHEVIANTGRIEIPEPRLNLSLDAIYEGVELPSLDEWLRQLRLREEEAAYG
ncbi:MAG: hypothetical protein K0S86_1258 [Geminicoccaceae bacterium]|nr:hypothetical protein [Geminicoccaceae bacterium]